MRLMAKDLQPIQVLRAERKPSGYVGTETNYKPYTVIQGQITPVNDNYSIAAYGERVSQMFNVNVEFGEDTRKGDKLVINGEECAVIAVLVYSSHMALTAERTGVLYGRSI